MKAIIFDMDGVIIDSTSISDKRMAQTALQYGVHLTEQELHTLHGLSGRGFWSYVKDTYHLPETVEYYNSKYDVEEEIRLYKNLKPINGIKELINDLKKHNVPLALATSASKYRMEKVLDLFDMQKTFDATVNADDVTQTKPDPEIFLKAAKKLQIKPEECIVIEDTVNGLQAAHNAGMKCVLYWVKKNPFKNSLKPSLVVNDFIRLSYTSLENV